MYRYVILLALSAVCIVAYTDTLFCNPKREALVSSLDAAIDVVKRVIYKYHGYSNCDVALDCADLLSMGHVKSGVYKIRPKNRLTENKFIEVYCDMETTGGGWTLFQRRGNFSNPPDYFYKDWNHYKEGFGKVAEDFWLGNDNLFALTNQKLYTVRFDLEDVDHNKRYAEYENFWIDDENNQYKSHISSYSGTAGDSMLHFHNNVAFSTYDRDNSNQPAEHCAQLYKGAWWHGGSASGGCHFANLNGLYLVGKTKSFADGINWHSWKGHHESLVKTEIKIRPRCFRRTYA